ncbi:MAG: class A beta-lactamase-related serine hydrolase [Bacteroidetes bacterium]|nr:class A beta-lactamase-related serine hydrolase [Bacteroidota bacterium]
MPIRIFLLLICFLCFSFAKAQKNDPVLEKQLQSLIAGFKGDIGIYVHNLKNHRQVAINADTIFPTASIVKIPILTGIMRKIEDGQLTYHQPLIYKDSLLYEGEDILGSFKNNEKIEMSKVLMLMLTTSDNTASLWLQSIAGTGTRINELMDSLGLTNTRVNSRTPGRTEQRNKWGWGQTTPREMGQLLEKIINHQVISYTASEKMLRLMSRNYWDEEAISRIPADVFIASKSGAIDASRSELLFVNGKKCSYVFSIFTKNNQDRSWEPTNEAWELTRKISELLWKYFN